MLTSEQSTIYNSVHDTKTTTKDQDLKFHNVVLCKWGKELHTEKTNTTCGSERLINKLIYNDHNIRNTSIYNSKNKETIYPSSDVQRKCG